DQPKTLIFVFLHALHKVPFLFLSKSSLQFAVACAVQKPYGLSPPNQHLSRQFYSYLPSIIRTGDICQLLSKSFSKREALPKIFGNVHTASPLDPRGLVGPALETLL